MWPWGHLAVAYLCFVVYTRVRGPATQTVATLTAVAAGSQVPDLIDKTFAWAIPILPSGRSLGHSLITAGIILTVFSQVARRDDLEPLVPAFGIGMISHALVDLGPGTIGGLLAGDPASLQWTTYLLCPLLAPPPYTHDDSFQYHILTLEPDPYMLFQLGLVCLAVTVWVAGGVPGTDRVRTVITSD